MVQSDQVPGDHPSVTLCLLTTVERQAPLFRVVVEPSDRNGLSRLSFAMADKLVTLPASLVARHLGRAEDAVMGRVDDAIRRWLAL